MSPQGRLTARSAEYQRKVLDYLAAAEEAGQRPSMAEMASTIGIQHTTLRRCLLWLQHEGFIQFESSQGRAKGVIRLVRNPDDDELAATLAGAS